jgi:hypothetical protein
MAKLQALPEKRFSERCRYTIPIEYAYFSKGPYFQSFTFNNCSEGMNFRSAFFLQPGSTILIRIKNFHPDGPCRGDCRGLKSLALAEVRWCEEIVDADSAYFDVGVKYYEPEY